jgi:hypothetical protein
VEPLSAMLAKEPDPEVRQMAAFALGMIGNPGAATALTTALANPDPLLQGRAAEALGKIGDKSSASAIATMIAAHVNAGVLKDIAPDDVSYPKSAPVEGRAAGTLRPRPAGRFQRAVERHSRLLWRGPAATGGRWPTRSSGSTIPERPRFSPLCSRPRGRSREPSPRGDSAS